MKNIGIIEGYYRDNIGIIDKNIFRDILHIHVHKLYGHTYIHFNNKSETLILKA